MLQLFHQTVHDRLRWLLMVACTRRMQKALSATRLHRPFTSRTQTCQSREQACNAFISRTLPPPPKTQTDTLGGLKVAVKDTFCAHQTLTTCASKALKDFISPYDSHVVSKLRQHGAEIVGKTNMDEFSMGSSSSNSYFGPVVNPQGFDLDKNQMIDFRSAGGSSGGSAAAVAAGECDIAIGSDTGGSVRLPAAYCGVVGLKPSYGLISRYGMVQYSNSLDTVGILSSEVDLIRKAFSCLQGYDAQDPTSIPLRTRLKSQELNEHWLKKRIERDSTDLSNLRVGVPIEYFTSDLSGQVTKGFKKAVDCLKRHGAQFVSISLPTTETCLGAYYVIASVEASSNLARYSGLHYGYRSLSDSPSSVNLPISSQLLYATTRSEALGIEVKRRLLLGSYALSASAMKNYFIQAQKVRLQVQSEFDESFRIPNVLRKDCIKKEEKKTTTADGGVDVIMTPATMNEAPTLKGLGGKEEGEEEEEGWSQDQLLVPASLAGLPAIVIPVHDHSHKWPIGIQFISPWGTEPILFHVASVLERINLK